MQNEQESWEVSQSIEYVLLLEDVSTIWFASEICVILNVHRMAKIANCTHNFPVVKMPTYLQQILKYFPIDDGHTTAFAVNVYVYCFHRHVGISVVEKLCVY